MEGLRSQNVSGCDREDLFRRVMLLLWQEAGFGKNLNAVRTCCPKVQDVSLPRGI